MALTLGMPSSSMFFNYCCSRSCLNILTFMKNRIGIAIGPRVWYGTKYKNSISRNGIVINNQFSGAFSYGIAITSATNFTVKGNSFFGNSSFIGARGPTCPISDSVPTPAPFITEAKTTSSMSISSNFVNVSYANSLTCMLPPNGGDFWPIRYNSSNLTTGSIPSPSGGRYGAIVGGIVLGGVVLAILLCGLATSLRKCILRRKARQQMYKAH
jgi:parallel beta-helix repeat protein